MPVIWQKRNFAAKIKAPKVSKVESKCTFITLWYYNWNWKGSQTIHLQIIEHSLAIHMNLRPNALLGHHFYSPEPFSNTFQVQNWSRCKEPEVQSVLPESFFAFLLLKINRLKTKKSKGNCKGLTTQILDQISDLMIIFWIKVILPTNNYEHSQSFKVMKNW